MDYKNRSNNEHFKQLEDYQNKIEFNRFGGAALTTEKFVIKFVRIGNGFIKHCVIKWKAREQKLYSVCET